MGGMCSICKVDSNPKHEVEVDNPTRRFEDSDSFYLDPDY